MTTTTTNYYYYYSTTTVTIIIIIIVVIFYKIYKNINCRAATSGQIGGEGYRQNRLRQNPVGWQKFRRGGGFIVRVTSYTPAETTAKR